MVLYYETLSHDEAQNNIRNLLFDLTRQLDLLISSITSGDGVKNVIALREQADVIKTVFLMIHSVGVSTHSILKLTYEIDMSIRDCFGIARSVSEGALNSAYIIAGGSPVAAKARRHALQKSYRDLSRLSLLGDVKSQYSNIPSKDSIPGLEDAILEFTTKSGKEVSEWSGQSIEQKIRTIVSKYPSVQISASMSNFSIYRRSSELLHGSYYGVNYFWDLNKFSNFNGDFKNLYVYNHIVEIFTAIYASLSMLIEVCCIEYDIPSLKKLHISFIKKANDLFKEVNE